MFNPPVMQRCVCGRKDAFNSKVCFQITLNTSAVDSAVKQQLHSELLQDKPTKEKTLKNNNHS